MSVDYLVGKGFIGSRLIQKLNNPVWIPHDRMQYFRPEPFDRFFYCASYGNIWGQDDTEEIIKANAWWPVRMLLQAQSVSFRSFVYLSSSSVNLPVQTPYSRAKRAAEELLQAIDKRVCTIRPFSVTGVGEQESHLIPRLIRSCLYGEEMEFAPWPEHDYIDVQDFARVALEISRQVGVFDVGSCVRKSNQDVLDTVERVTGNKANTRPGKARPYDTPNWRSRHGYAGNSLEETITEMVEHERARTQNT